MIAVFDLLGDNRKVKTFHGLTIQHADDILSQLSDENNAVIVAVGHYNVCAIVNQLLASYSFLQGRLFVVNPYQLFRRLLGNISV